MDTPEDHRFTLFIPWDLYVGLHRLADEDFRNIPDTILFLIDQELTGRGWAPKRRTTWQDQVERRGWELTIQRETEEAEAEAEAEDE
jgi:hypothetical protein